MPDRPNDAARAFADGFFEVLGALLSNTVSFDVDAPAPTLPEHAAQALEQWPVAIQARTRGGGAAALLFTLKDALRLAGAVFGKEQPPGDALAEHDLATLAEFGQHAMERAIERSGEAIALTFTLDAVNVSQSGPLAPERLAPVLESPALMAGVRFSAPNGLQGDAVLLFPAAWNSAQEAAEPEPEPEPEPAPREAPAAEAAANPEWDAILAELNSQLTPNKEVGMAPEPQNPLVRPAAAPAQVPSGNLDMVLDIRLVVRARLGRVEMPIGDILGLGPGSIIEVGRMLDEPVELLVNDKLIARGDVVVVDEKFGLRITEIVSPRERIESLR